MDIHSIMLPLIGEIIQGRYPPILHRDRDGAEANPIFTITGVYETRGLTKEVWPEKTPEDGKGNSRFGFRYGSVDLEVLLPGIYEHLNVLSPDLSSLLFGGEYAIHIASGPHLRLCKDLHGNYKVRTDTGDLYTRNFHNWRGTSTWELPYTLFTFSYEIIRGVS